MDDKLNMSQQCDTAAKAANMSLGCINRSIVNRPCEAMVAHILLLLENSGILHPKYSRILWNAPLEYGIRFWVPQLKSDINKLMHVQRRVIMLGTFGLEKRQLRGNYKYNY